MLSHSRKRDREFQTELLRVQLRFERENALFSALASVGISLFVFAITFSLTVASIPEFPVSFKTQVINFMYIFLGVGGSLMVFSIIGFLIGSRSEKREIEKIKEKFLKEQW